MIVFAVRKVSKKRGPKYSLAFAKRILAHKNKEFNQKIQQ